MWSLVVGFFLPVAIAFIQQRHWKNGFRAIVAFLCCLLAASGTVLIQVGSWDWHKWVQSALLIVVASISTYHGFWKPTTIAPSVEDATSPKQTA